MPGVILPTPDVDSVLKFLRVQNPTRTSEIRDQRERRTNVGTSVSPRDRHELDKFFEHRDHTDTAVKLDTQGKEALSEPDGEIPTTLLEAQIGRPMTCAEIQKRLHKLNDKLYFWRSNAFPDIMGIYVHDDDAPMQSNGHRLRHVLGFEFGYSPEFTVRHPNAEGYKKLTRGWRAVILSLAKDGFINFEAACKAFNITAGRGSRNWQREVAAGPRRGVGSPHVSIERQAGGYASSRAATRQVQTVTRPINRGKRHARTRARAAER